MTGDNCGSSQHLLLLDEFYRSAVRLAGQRLLWQIVPPEMEECYDEYVQGLCRQGIIDCADWIILTVKSYSSRGILWIKFMAVI